MNFRRRTRLFFTIATLRLVLFALPAFAAEVPDLLPDPNGKPADMSNPVQVYILMGQSNMVGAGRIAGDKDGSVEHAVKARQKYPDLVDDAGKARRTAIASAHKSKNEFSRRIARRLTAKWR